jgi:hypothetical protein
MTLVIRFEPGLRPVIKHQEHDQSTHGSWANSSERSAKEIEVQQRITDVKIGSFERDKYDEDDKNLYQKIEAKYKTKDGKTYLLSQENIKTPDGNNKIEVISYEPKTLANGKEGRKQIGSLRTEGRDSSIIDDVYVDEGKQRQGIATAMLNMARTYAPNNMKISHSFSLTDDAKGWSGVVKHGTHDQKTHGNWATGGGDTAINKFENAANQAYGTGEEAFTIDYTGDNSVAALGEYLARGHTVNDNIRSSGDLDRGDGKTYADSSVVKGLDNAIEMAPRMPNQKVWRTASAEAIENLKVNGVYIDKGFTSTTAVDITHPDNGMLLLTLSTVSSGRKALMEIDTGSVGKGLYIPKMFPGQPIAEKEREFLLPRETKMRYLGSDFNISPSGKTIVEIHKFKVED